jgi:hypothetical protein
MSSDVKYKSDQHTVKTIKFQEQFSEIKNSFSELSEQVSQTYSKNELLNMPRKLLLDFFEIYSSFATVSADSLVKKQRKSISFYDLLTETITWILYEHDDSAVLTEDDMFDLDKSFKDIIRSLEMMMENDAFDSIGKLKNVTLKNFVQFIEIYDSYFSNFIDFVIDSNEEKLSNDNNSVFTFLIYISISNKEKFIELCKTNKITSTTKHDFLKFYKLDDGYVFVRAILSYIIFNKITHI